MSGARRRRRISIGRGISSIRPRASGAEGKAISFSRRNRARVLPTKATKVLPPKNKGGGAPKRRNCPVGPRHAIRCCHLLALRARPRAPAETRSPFGAPPRFLPGHCRDSAPGRVSRDAGFAQALPALACLSSASSSQTGRNAGRAGPQGRPGAVCETARRHRTRPASQIASGMRPFAGRVVCSSYRTPSPRVKDE